MAQPREMPACPATPVTDPASSGLTRPQARALAFVGAYLAEYGQPPTLREIATELGAKSTNYAHQIVDALVRKGRLTRRPMVARGLRLVKTEGG